LGHVSTVKLSEAGLPISEIDPLGGMTVYEYDDAGRTTAVVDPGGKRTEYVYDELGNLLSLVRPDGAAVSTTFDAASKPIEIVDPNGNAWQQSWDARGLLIEQTSPLGHTSRYEYDGWGQLIAYTNARGARTVLRFDLLGNLTELQDALQQRTLFAHDVLGNVIAKGDALDRRTHYQYDPKGRLLAVKLPSGSLVQCAHDAEDNLTHYTDENGAQTRLEYFGQGEIAKRIQPDGHSVDYLYDTEERLIGVRNQRGELYQLRRDPLGRVVEEIDYWGQSRRYAYDGSGHLTASLDPLGRRIDYRCDPLGRILEKLLPAMAGPEAGAQPVKETFAYDANGNLVATANQHVQVERAFDAEGRLLQEVQQHTQGQAFTIANSYDANGNRTKRETTHNATHSAGPGHTTEYAYDLLDQVIGVRIDGGAPMRLQRDALGQLTHEELAPGLNRQLRYNSDGLLTEQSLHAGNQGLFATRYDYDRAGNLTSRHDSAFGKDTYLYDPMGRILKHTDPQGVLHEFFNDPAGDRLITQVSGSGSASAVVGRNDEWQRQGSHQGTHYRFDRAGNLTHKQDSQQLLELAWDANQRLIASRRTTKGAPPSVTTYGYDPLGRRLFKETQGQRTWFGWDGDAMTLDVIDGEAREFIYRPETFEPLAVLGQTAQGQQLGTLHYVNDPNGCPTRLIDGQGQVLWAASYSAWGAVDKLHASTVSNPIRLQGQYEDGETGLYYNRRRYFEPMMGVFCSSDPIGLAGGLNLHEYAPNSLMWIDPWGLTCGPAVRRNKAGRWIDARGKFAKNPPAPNFVAESMRHEAGIAGTAKGYHGHGTPNPVNGAGVSVPKSKFSSGEGGAPFSKAVYEHPDVRATQQGNGRWSYEVSDLKRDTGTNQAGGVVRGGQVIVEGNPALNPTLYNPGEVVTQYPK
jgi:RHS repeat-associated protein